MNELVRVEQLTKLYGPKKEAALTVLQDVSFVIREGDFVSIMGPSGSGKSTLLHILGFLDFAYLGDFFWKGKNVKTFSKKELPRLRACSVGFVFQFFNLLPYLTSLENVMIAAYVAGLSKKEAKARAIQWLSKLGLEERLSHRPSQLSGGEQQRVAIARALINEPSLLLCDEPTGNLDRENGLVIMDLLKELSSVHKQTIVMVTHDSDVAKFAATQLLLNDKKIQNNYF